MSKSSHTTHPIMLVIICANYGENPSRIVGTTEWTTRITDEHMSGQTDRLNPTYTPPPPIITNTNFLMTESDIWLAIWHDMHQDTIHLSPPTVYPKKYAHGFVVLCFVVVMQSFIMNSHEVFIHIHQGCFAGTGVIVRLPQCQWSKPDGYGKISQCITTTKHSKAKTVCIFLGIYCIVSHITQHVSVFAKLYSSTSANNSILAGVQYISMQKNFASTSAIKQLTSAKADVVSQTLM